MLVIYVCGETWIPIGICVRGNPILGETHITVTAVTAALLYDVIHSSAANCYVCDQTLSLLGKGCRTMHTCMYTHKAKDLRQITMIISYFLEKGVDLEYVLCHIIVTKKKLILQVRTGNHTCMDVYMFLY